MVEIEQKRYADDITTQELVRLRVENEKQAAEIERLREQERKMTDHALERMEEIERLREALKRIVQVTDYGSRTSTTLSEFAINNANILARSALQQKDSE